MVGLVDIGDRDISVQVEDDGGQNENAADRNEREADEQAGVECPFFSQDDLPFFLYFRGQVVMLTSTESNMKGM